MGKHHPFFIRFPFDVLSPQLQLTNCDQIILGIKSLMYGMYQSLAYDTLYLLVNQLVQQLFPQKSYKEQKRFIQTLCIGILTLSLFIQNKLITNSSKIIHIYIHTCMWCKCNTVYSTVHVCLRNKILNLTTYIMFIIKRMSVLYRQYTFL